jgi:hypothetical protein
MDAAKARKVRILKSRNAFENIGLRTVSSWFETRRYCKGPQCITAAQLHDGIRFALWVVFIGKADFHRAKAHVRAAFGHAIREVSIGSNPPFRLLCNSAGCEKGVDEGLIVVSSGS